MADVARMAAVSQTTVSLVLNDVPGIRISDAARRRVLEACNTLGYRIGPRGAGRLQVIGFLADELSTSPFTAVSADSARDALLERNAVLMVASTRNDAAVETAVLDLWAKQGVSGVIYSRIFTRVVRPPPQLAAVPAVLLNCRQTRPSLPAVVPAEQDGGCTATQHLIEAGHRRIAMIGGEPWMEAARQRANGYRQALREAGLPAPAELFRVGNWTQASGYAETAALLRLAKPPTAIFCANDLMAQGCYDAAREFGLQIPEQLSVVGYDNRPLSQFMEPALTTVDLPHSEMGRWAAEVLLESLPSRIRTTRMLCSLVKRGSVAPPANGLCAEASAARWVGHGSTRNVA